MPRADLTDAWGVTNSISTRRLKALVDWLDEWTTELQPQAPYPASLTIWPLQDRRGGFDWYADANVLTSPRIIIKRPGLPGLLDALGEWRADIIANHPDSPARGQLEALIGEIRGRIEAQTWA